MLVILATPEMEIRMVGVQGQPWAKSLRDSISTNKKLGRLACIYHPSYVRSINRKITVQAGPGIKSINMGPYSKNS
jgi:hypothetical protein